MLRRSTRLLQASARNEVNVEAIHTTLPYFKWDVQRDYDSKQFYVKLGKDKATIDYEPISDKILELYHTSVPEVFQGKGVGKILAKGTFDYCVANNLKMKLTCEYLQKFYKDNEKKYASKIVMA